MFLSRNKKNNVYPSKPQFCYIKVVFKGVKRTEHYMGRAMRKRVFEHMQTAMDLRSLQCLRCPLTQVCVCVGGGGGGVGGEGKNPRHKKQ